MSRVCPYYYIFYYDCWSFTEVSSSGAQLRYYVLCNSLPAWQADSAKFLQVRSLTCDFTTGCGLNNNTVRLVASTTANSVSPVTRTNFVFILEDFKFISPLCRVVYCMNFCWHNLCTKTILIWIKYFDKLSKTKNLRNKHLATSDCVDSYDTKYKVISTLTCNECLKIFNKSLFFAAGELLN